MSVLCVVHFIKLWLLFWNIFLIASAHGGPCSHFKFTSETFSMRVWRIHSRNGAIHDRPSSLRLPIEKRTNVLFPIEHYINNHYYYWIERIITREFFLLVRRRSIAAIRFESIQFCSFLSTFTRVENWRVVQKVTPSLSFASSDFSDIFKRSNISFYTHTRSQCIHSQTHTLCARVKMQFSVRCTDNRKFRNRKYKKKIVDEASLTWQMNHSKNRSEATT